MSTPADIWENRFTKLFHHAVKKYEGGHQKASGLVDEDGKSFLSSIGYTEQEFFDFIEDFAKAGEPSLESAMSIASVRRDYFLKEQKGVPGVKQISVDNLPPKDAMIDGIAWLPRLIAKAQAKLRGEMPPDLMYGCGGDRRFFRAHDIDGAEFLKKTWSTNGNPSEIIGWIKGKAK